MPESAGRLQQIAGSHDVWFRRFAGAAYRIREPRVGRRDEDTVVGISGQNPRKCAPLPDISHLMVHS